MNTKQQQTILQRWQGMEWTLCSTITGERKPSISTRKRAESISELAEEVESVTKANVLMERNSSITKELERASVTEHHDVRKRKARKSWGEYSQQHKRQKLEQVKDAVGLVLCDEKFEVLDITVKDKQSDKILNLAVKQQVKELVEQWEIFPMPEGSIGVQQSLKKQLTESNTFYI